MVKSDEVEELMTADGHHERKEIIKEGNEETMIITSDDEKRLVKDGEKFIGEEVNHNHGHVESVQKSYAGKEVTETIKIHTGDDKPEAQ